MSNTAECGFLPGGTHLVHFTNPNYCHGCYLTDNSTAWDATADFSNNNGGTWNTENPFFPHSVQTMMNAISCLSW
ncbi:MAG: hypothetical protein KGO22_11270 [Gammaproteobacteria bacterium]|nr:hypothetical protein [Gammaproteobacteria bacterium]